MNFRITAAANPAAANPAAVLGTLEEVADGLTKAGMPVSKSQGFARFILMLPSPPLRLAKARLASGKQSVS